MNQSLNQQDPALPVMTMDILSNVLSHADSPGDLGKYLCTEIRELTGARCVVLAECLNAATEKAYRVISVNPQRRQAWTESSVSRRVFEMVSCLTAVKIWHAQESSGIAEVLLTEGFTVSLAMPLHVGTVRVGALLVFGLPDEAHLEGVVELLTMLSTIVALVLQNAFLYEQQEQTIRDRTARLRTAHEVLKEKTVELQQNRNTLAHIMDSVPQSIFWKDRDSVYLGCNQAFARAVGLDRPEEIVGKTDFDLPWLPEDTESYLTDDREVIDHRRPKRRIIEPVQQADGTRSWVETTKVPLINESDEVYGVLGVYEDITERKRAEELIIQTEKMLSVGGLAAGMAHEINNPLAGIVQNVQLIRSRLSQDLKKNRDAATACGIDLAALTTYLNERDIYDSIESIREAGQRAARIVNNMLSFSRKGDTHREFWDLRTLLDKTLELAASDYDLKKNYDFRRIEIERQYDPEIPLVLCEPSKIQQVFLNLLKNGAQAMALRDNASRFVLRMGLDEDMVRIEIKDNGPGMAETVRKRVFEPFFTTKEVNVGTGLGLSVSYFIITEDHGGALEVESTPGAGTVFTIRLPRGEDHD